MDVITRRDRIKSVVTSWYRQYKKHIDGHMPQGRDVTDKVEVYSNLQKLDLEKCSREEVDQIIGNNSWTQIQCEECGADVDKGMKLGSGAGGEYSREIFCGSCLEKAYNKIKEVIRKDWKNV